MSSILEDSTIPYAQKVLSVIFHVTVLLHEQMNIGECYTVTFISPL